MNDNSWFKHWRLWSRCLIEKILEDKVTEFACNVSYTPALILMYIFIPMYLSTEYNYLTKRSVYSYMGISNKTTSLVDLVKGSSI